MNYQKWIARFEQNRQNRPEPDWAAPFFLAEPQRRALVATLAEYQLGDGGGPCRLIAQDAEAFRDSSPLLRQVVDLWFREEKEHSRLLLDGLRRLGGEPITETFGQDAFCWVRRLLGVQFEMMVLLIVEIVSTAYYRIIRKHVKDRPLAAMCRLILRDEVGHIAFHRDRLSSRYPRGVSWPWRVAFHGLGLGCASFLWFSHGRYLRVLGAEWRDLFSQTRSGLRLFLRQLDAALPKRAAGAGILRRSPEEARRAFRWASL